MSVICNHWNRSVSYEDRQPSEHFTEDYAQAYKTNLKPEEHSGNCPVGVNTCERQVINRCCITDMQQCMNSSK